MHLLIPSGEFGDFSTARLLFIASPLTGMLPSIPLISESQWSIIFEMTATECRSEITRIGALVIQSVLDFGLDSMVKSNPPIVR